jgi:hypothetical protein
MLKVIKSKKGPCSNPTTKNTYCLPGLFGELNNRGKVVISRGKDPCGIIDDVKTKTDNTILDGQITFWSSPGIFETDKFEKSGKYNKNTILYVNLSGKLTSRKMKSFKEVGKVLFVKENKLRFKYYGYKK